MAVRVSVSEGALKYRPLLSNRTRHKKLKWLSGSKPQRKMKPLSRTEEQLKVEHRCFCQIDSLLTCSFCGVFHMSSRCVPPVTAEALSHRCNQSRLDKREPNVPVSLQGLIVRKPFCAMAATGWRFQKTCVFFLPH